MTHVKIGKDTRQRLEIMTQTSDGFLISEADMKLRGPGDLEGTLQSGIAFNLKIANLTSDGQIIQVARESVLKILDANPSLTVNLENPQQSESATSSATLSYNSINIIKRELKARFTNQYDWGRIS